MDQHTIEVVFKAFQGLEPLTGKEASGGLACLGIQPLYPGGQRHCFNLSIEGRGDARACGGWITKQVIDVAVLLQIDVRQDPISRIDGDQRCSAVGASSMNRPCARCSARPSTELLGAVVRGLDCRYRGFEDSTDLWCIFSMVGPESGRHGREVIWWLSTTLW